MTLIEGVIIVKIIIINIIAYQAFVAVFIVLLAEAQTMHWRRVPYCLEIIGITMENTVVISSLLRHINP